MPFAELISPEAAGGRPALLVASSLAGAASALVLALVNANAAAAAPDDAGQRLFAMFPLTIGLYALCARQDAGWVRRDDLVIGPNP